MFQQINNNMKEALSPRINSPEVPRKTGKGTYTQQYVSNKYTSIDPFQQKFDRFLKAFEHICLKFETSIDRQNFKISNIQTTLAEVIGGKLDKLVAIGERIEQTVDRSNSYRNKMRMNDKMVKRWEGDQRHVMFENQNDRQKQKDRQKSQTNYLKHSITSLTQNDARPLLKALPPLPTLERCISPSSPNNQKKSLFSDYCIDQQKKFVQFDDNPVVIQQSSRFQAPTVEQEKSLINTWVGQFYNSTAASYFQLYSLGKINYEDMKIKFSYDILNQSLNIFNRWTQQYKNKLSTEEMALRRPEFYHLLNQSSKSILEFLISKYPPSRRKKIDTELSDKISINNKFSVIKYDMLSNSKMNIGMVEKQTDFTKEIKIWLNVLVTETKKQFPIFKSKMKDIFINTDGSIDGSKGMDSELEFVIGSKISQGTPLFTEEELEAPGLQVKSTQLLRILMKWCEELLSYFTNPNQKIYGNTSGFKTVRGALPIKIPKSRLDELASKLKNIYEKQILPQLKVEDKNVGYLVTDLLKIVLQGVQNFQFLNERQISIVKLSEYLNESLKVCVLRFLNLILSRLVKVRSKYEDQRLQSNLHLVTFNVMDLLRCRCVGSKSQIYRIFKKIRDSDYFDIIRVKNKLHEPTRDILINLKIKNSFLICEVQLSLGEAQEKVNDHFCHFLYELERTNFGVLLESASQICNLDPRMNYVYGHKDIQFKGLPQKKLNLIQNIKPSKNGPSCQCSHPETQMKYCSNDQPFCCALCTSFKGGFTLCLPYLNCPVCSISICPQCVIMISKNFSEFIESYTSNGSDFYELIRFFYPDHLYEEVGDSSSTAAKIPGFLQKYPYVLHMVVDNVGHKPVLYKRYLNSYTEAFSTLQDQKRLVKSSFCWNYLIALKPYERKTVVELKDYKKYSLNKQWNELEEILKQNNISQLIVVIDKQSQSALIVDIIESEKEIQTCQMKRQVQKTIRQANKFQSNFLELTSKNLPDISLLQGIQNKNQIQVLNLWENKIKDITLLSKFQKIQELFLRQNQIEDIKPILEMKQLESAFICDNKFKGSLPILNFPNLTALDISLNEFTDMNNLSKSDLKNMVFFRMVNTKITEIPVISLPKLEIFWFDHNDISSLQNLVLSITPELTKVSGTHNSISGELPRLLFPKLQSLILNYNRITSIQNFQQSSLPNLKSLALHHNAIKGCLPFLQLRSLTKLDLSYNKISAIPGTLFVNSRFPSLESIDLKFNQILGDFPLIQLKSLRKLDVSNNLITNIQMIGGSKIPSLEFLDMSKNKIKGSLPILRLLKLRRAFFSHNEITDIHSLGDSKMPRLAVIKLNNNKISSPIPKMYLEGLKLLDLTNNEITDVELLSYLHLVPSLERINLFGNPDQLKINISSKHNHDNAMKLINFSEVTSE